MEPLLQPCTDKASAANLNRKMHGFPACFLAFFDELIVPIVFPDVRCLDVVLVRNREFDQVNYLSLRTPNDDIRLFRCGDREEPLAFSEICSNLPVPIPARVVCR